MRCRRCVEITGRGGGAQEAGGGGRSGRDSGQLAEPAERTAVLVRPRAQHGRLSRNIGRGVRGIGGR